MSNKKLNLEKINPESDSRVTIGITTTGKTKLRLAKEAQDNDMTLSEYCELILIHSKPEMLLNVSAGIQAEQNGLTEESIKALIAQALDENNPLLIDLLIEQIKDSLDLPTPEEKKQTIKLLEKLKSKEGKKSKEKAYSEEEDEEEELEEQEEKEKVKSKKKAKTKTKTDEEEEPEEEDEDEDNDHDKRLAAHYAKRAKEIYNMSEEWLREGYIEGTSLSAHYAKRAKQLYNLSEEALRKGFLHKAAYDKKLADHYAKRANELSAIAEDQLKKGYKGGSLADHFVKRAWEISKINEEKLREGFVED